MIFDIPSLFWKTLESGEITQVSEIGHVQKERQLGLE